MKRRFLSCLAALVLLTGCFHAGGEADAFGKIEVAYYVPGLRGTTEFPVDYQKYEVDNLSGLELVREALALLRVLPSPEWMDTIFPDDMDIKAISLEGGRARIDLSERYITAGTAEMVIMDYCIVSTLCRLEVCDSVRLYVNGSSHPVYGDAYLTTRDFVSDEALLEPEPVRLLMYFANPDSSGTLRGETHLVKITGGRATEQYVMEELIRGPQSGELEPVMPPGSELLSIFTEKEICFVNLNEEFVINQTGSDSDVNRSIYAIVDSLTELPHITSVRFLISGEAIRYYHGIYIGEPLVRRAEFIEAG